MALSFIRRTYVLGTAAAMAVAMPQFVAAQDQDDDVQEFEAFEVTGSRITRTDFEGPAPVTVINREDIDASGDASVADYLRGLAFNSFGSFNPASGFAGGAQGQAVLSLRGLGSERTLVLIDGRRIAASPALAGAAQNLNTLPLAAVERVEVLREGASAIYGSDAIGGVINVILRKDYTGVEASVQVERPTQEGADASYASFVAGLATDRGNVVITADHFQRDIIFSRDRDYLAAQAPSPLGFPGSFYRVGDGGVFDAQPVPGTEDQFVQPFDSCPDSFGSSDNPSSSVGSFPLFSGADELCLFRFTDVSAQTAEEKRDTITLNGNYKINDHVNGFTRLSTTRGESFGRFAPAPLTPVFGGLTMDADNPNNPTQNDPDGPDDIVILYRLTPLGNRDSTVTDDVNQFLFGANGNVDFLGFSNWEVSGFHNRYTQADIGVGYGLRPPVQALVDAGTFDPFNPDPSAVGQFATTILTNNAYTATGFDGRISLGNLLGSDSAYQLPLVVGGEYRDEEFQSLVDSQSAAGNVFGSAGSSAQGARSYYAIFAETGMTFFEDLLEVTLAVRRDTYSDFGSATSPKFGIGFRPVSSLLIRGSYSEGFRAPDLEILNRQPAQSFPDSTDQLRCDSFAAENDGEVDSFACDENQREAAIGGNPALDAEDSESINFGVVWSPTTRISFALDYYDIEVTNGIENLSAQDVLDNDQRCFNQGRQCDPTQEGQVVRAGGPYTPGDTSTVGQAVLINAPAANFAVIQTKGVDFDAGWEIPSPLGNFNLRTNLSYVLEFKDQTSPFGSPQENVDTFFVPEWRGNATVDWSMSTLGASLTLNYVPETSDCSQSDLVGGSADCDRSIDSFTTVDAQFNVGTAFGGEFAIGARNLFNEDPPLSIEAGSAAAPETDQTLYDIFGRVPYIRYTQKF